MEENAHLRTEVPQLQRLVCSSTRLPQPPHAVRLLYALAVLWPSLRRSLSLQLDADQSNVPLPAAGEQYFGLRVPAIERLPEEYQLQYYRWIAVIHTPQHNAAAGSHVGDCLCSATGQVVSLAHAVENESLLS